MTVTILPSTLQGAVTPPHSKSQAHRLLIASALAGEDLEAWEAEHLSQDIQATRGCLEQLLQQGCGPVCLDCRESGSTLRFLIPLALALREGGTFQGRGRLMERPQEPYFRLFDRMGISYSRQGNQLTVKGRLCPGEYALPGDVSSQFVTGLLFALPLLKGDSVIRLLSPLESRNYVDMTLQVLQDHGIQVEEIPQGYRVPGGQQYRPGQRQAEADYSQAAFWYAAIGLGSRIEIQGLNPASSQGDMRIVDSCVKLCQEGTVELDVSQCPDLAPALAVHAALREGQLTRIVNARRLRLKECDRLAAITRELNRLGAWVVERDDALDIYGVRTLTGAETDSHNDHRIAMMLAVAATRATGPVRIRGAESVAKSYPTFWEEYQALGGHVQCTTDGEERIACGISFSENPTARPSA